MSSLAAAKLAAGTVPHGRLPVSLARYNAATAAFAGSLISKRFGGPGGGASAFVVSGTRTVPKGEVIWTRALTFQRVDKDGNPLQIASEAGRRTVAQGRNPACATARERWSNSRPALDAPGGLQQNVETLQRKGHR